MNKRTWAEIDLNAIAHNIQEIRRITSPNAKIMAVVKADAYGHGFLEVTKTLLNNGADCLAVAMLDEAVQLRKYGIDVPILVLGATSTDVVEQLVDFDIIPTVFNYDIVKALSDCAKKKNKTVKIHIKIDTGMGRLGYLAGENNEKVIDEIIEISKMPNIIIDGIYSHFACSDEEDTEYTKTQYNLFIKLCNELEQKGLFITTKHICNSAGIMMYPEMHLDMVRPGIIMYGLYPSHDVDRSRLDLIPAMTLKARVTLVKEVEANHGISYGKTYITDKKTKIATIPIGYADGYNRLLEKQAKMMVGNTCVDVIGRICMDQCMIDVTNVNTISISDEVTIFGTEIITADSVASWLHTINYEVVCIVGKRIPRIYILDGKAVKKLNYLI